MDQNDEIGGFASSMGWCSGVPIPVPDEYAHLRPESNPDLRDQLVAKLKAIMIFLNSSQYEAAGHAVDETLALLEEQ